MTSLDRKKILLHVGFPKTATTSLQDHVFARARGVKNLGKPKPTSRVKRALRQIVRRDPGDLDPVHIETLRRAVARAAPFRGRIVLSHEGFTGARNVAVGDSKALRRSGFWALREAAAERLHTALSGAQVEVLFTIREQRSWILSNYADLVLREGLARPLRDWLEAGLSAPDDFYADPDFARSIALYESLFGEGRVHVLAFEALRTDPNAFARSLAELGGWTVAEVTKRIASLPRSKTRSQLRVPRNRYIAKRWREVEARDVESVEIPAELDTDLAQAVAKACEAGNRWIAERFALPLADWGYPVSVSGDEQARGARSSRS